MPKPVTDEYAELVHYTTATGLAGIVASGCLWATHASFLNDAEEIKHFFDSRLLELAYDEVLKYTKELAEVQSVRAQMQAEGGVEAVARSEARKCLHAIRTSTISMNDPYVFSMSAAPDARTASSGLLSQWRGYGLDGGYAIVFETAPLEQLLRVEDRAFHYQHFSWADVHYYGGPDSQPSAADVAEYESALRTGIANWIRGGDPAETVDFYHAVTSLSCLCKHWGFFEEREVRVVAIPAHPEVAAASAEKETRPQKSIKVFPRGGAPIPYIELFESRECPNTPTRLPIKRVIVGPHRDGALRLEAVRRLLAANTYKAEVVCSEIPYIGR